MGEGYSHAPKIIGLAGTWHRSDLCNAKNNGSGANARSWSCLLSPGCLVRPGCCLTSPPLKCLLPTSLPTLFQTLVGLRSQPKPGWEQAVQFPDFRAHSSVEKSVQLSPPVSLQSLGVANMLYDIFSVPLGWQKSIVPWPYPLQMGA